MDWLCYKKVYGELQEGKCSQGGQKKDYKDTLKASRKDFDTRMGVLGTDCDQSGEVSSTKELSMTKRESVKLKKAQRT